MNSDSKSNVITDSPIDIEIWKFSLSGNPAEPHFHLAELVEEERSRIDQGIFPELGERSFRSRLGLRRILANYLDCSPAEVPLMIEGHGKPILNGEASLQFNLSHCGEYAILAVSKQTPLGIDLERIRKESPIDDLAQRCFSIEEQEGWSKTEKEKRRTSFFHLWVQKEAMVKAHGAGMTLPLRHFSGEPNAEILEGPIKSELPEIGENKWRYIADTEGHDMRSAIVFCGSKARIVTRDPEEVNLSRWSL